MNPNNFFDEVDLKASYASNASVRTVATQRLLKGLHKRPHPLDDDLQELERQLFDEQK